MADKVAFTIETMVTELQHLERRGYFSTDEIKEIIRKREKMEYAMIKNSSSKSDFLEAVQFEMDLVD